MEQTAENYFEYYEKQIKPYIKEIEQIRIEQLDYFKWAVIIGAIAAVGLLTTVFPYFFEKLDAEVYVWTTIISFLPAFYIAQKYSQRVKDKFLPKILNYFGEFSYSSDSDISALNEDIFSEILPAHDIFNTEDYIKGQYRDNKIELIEAHLKIRTRKSTRTVFRGLLVVFEVNKPFVGKTIITKDYGCVGNFFKEQFTSLEKIKLEDPEFENYFEVYGTDQIESRYLLTTAFMNRLLKLDELMGSDTIRCSFCYGNLYLAIPVSRNSLESGSIFSSPKYEDFDNVFKELEQVFGIIDILKLDQKTGL